MKINSIRKLQICFFFIIAMSYFVRPEKESEKIQNKETTQETLKSNEKNSQILHDVVYERPSEMYTRSNQYVTPHITRPAEYDFQSRTVIPLTNQPVHQVVQSHFPQACPCAAAVPVSPCRPCGVIPLSVPEPVLPIIDCPCAPKPHCPVCPPLSLLHDIASKKVTFS